MNGTAEKALSSIPVEEYVSARDGQKNPYVSACPHPTTNVGRPSKN